MRTNFIVVGGLATLLAALTAAAQGNPQQRPPTEQQTQPPSEQMTTPPGQRTQQGGQRTRQPMESQPQLTPQASGRAEQARTGPPPEEKSSVTHHSANIGGQQINYTATAGTYIIKADDGTPKATFFFVAYTKDGVSDIARRPLSFVYNGGPGSGSLFTHMGMGPRRVVLESDGKGMPAPYEVEDNRDSFLDSTDMVFVDAVSTGFSRPAPGQNPSQFYGVIEDANIFSDFIYEYITRNARWAFAQISNWRELRHHALRGAFRRPAEPP